MVLLEFMIDSRRWFPNISLAIISYWIFPSPDLMLADKQYQRQNNPLRWQIFYVWLKIELFFSISPYFVSTTVKRLNLELPVVVWHNTIFLCEKRKPCCKILNSEVVQNQKEPFNMFYTAIKRVSLRPFIRPHCLRNSYVVFWAGAQT